MWLKMLEFQCMWFGHSCYQENVYHLYQYVLKATVMLLALWFYHLISRKCFFTKHKQISTIPQPIFLEKISLKLPVNTFRDVTNHLAFHICGLKSKGLLFYNSNTSSPLNMFFGFFFPGNHHFIAQAGSFDFWPRSRKAQREHFRRIPHSGCREEEVSGAYFIVHSRAHDV